MSVKYKSMMYRTVERFSGSLRCILILCAHITGWFSTCKWCTFNFPFVVPCVTAVKWLFMLYRVMYTVPRLLAIVQLFPSVILFYRTRYNIHNNVTTVTHGTIRGKQNVRRVICKQRIKKPSRLPENLCTLRYNTADLYFMLKYFFLVLTLILTELWRLSL